MGFLISLIDACVRSLSYGMRAFVAAILFCVAVLSFKLCFRKKNDKHPIAWGYYVLCLLSVFVAIVYLVV